MYSFSIIYAFLKLPTSESIRYWEIFLSAFIGRSDSRDAEGNRCGYSTIISTVIQLDDLTRQLLTYHQTHGMQRARDTGKVRLSNDFPFDLRWDPDGPIALKFEYEHLIDCRLLIG